MKDIKEFWNPNDSAFRLRVTAAALVTTGIIITLAALGFVYRVSARGNSIECVMPPSSTTSQPRPTETEPTAGSETVPSETEPPCAEVLALQEALAAAEAERDALRTQLSESTADTDQLQEELDALRSEQETAYTLLIHLERNASFPYSCEVIRFTLTVDREIYELWEPGDIITDHDGFLTLPSDGLFHDWTVVLEDKYVTTDAG